MKLGEREPFTKRKPALLSHRETNEVTNMNMLDARVHFAVNEAAFAAAGPTAKEQALRGDIALPVDGDGVLHVFRDDEDAKRQAQPGESIWSPRLGELHAAGFKVLIHV